MWGTTHCHHNRKRIWINIYRPFGNFFLQKTRNSAVLLLILFHFGDIGESCFAFVSIWTDWHLAWKGDRKPLKYLNSIQLLAQPGKLLQFLDTTHSSFACSQVLLAWSKGLKSIFFSSLYSHFFNTRPKPAYGRQGLDWIVRPRYSFVVFSTNKTMETNQKSW